MNDSVNFGGLPCGRIPLVVGVVSAERTLDRLGEQHPRSFDAVELRVDFFESGSNQWLISAQKLEAAGIPVLLTIRHRREGGRWSGPEEARIALYLKALPHVSAVDVEIYSEAMPIVARAAAESGKVVVGSFHDFDRTPVEAELSAVVHEGIRAGASIVKIATFIHSDAEAARLKDLLVRFPRQRLALLGMGPLGMETRVSFPMAGSCLTYGFLDESTAPGQLSAAKLRERLIAEHSGYSEFARTRT